MNLNEVNNNLKILEGQVVSGVSFRGMTRIEFGDKQGFVLKSESDIALVLKGTACRFRGTEPGENLEVLKDLIGKKAAYVFMNENAEFDIEFDDDSKLIMFPDDHFESWQLIGPNRFMVVSLPGGELAIWTGKL